MCCGCGGDGAGGAPSWYDLAAAGMVRAPEEAGGLPSWITELATALLVAIVVALVVRQGGRQ